VTADPPKRRGRPPAGGREAILAATLQLLRERGIARLTTREVASLAGVSEASVYYHYTDRAGLLKAVFEEGLRPLQALNERGIGGPDRLEVLTTLTSAIERFLDQALPVLNAAQSDRELRDSLAAYMNDQDLGPHRGVRALGAYLAGEQASARVRADVDPQAVAMMLVGVAFLRASQRLMLGDGNAQLPDLEDAVAALDAMLRPPSGVQA
jgi:AcrR family transcriptional regulator